MFWSGFLRSVLLLLTGVFLLSGCTPSGSGPLDEEKEPHYLAGKERVGTMDWRGAIECFEKALQVNPHSSAAHFELGWIYDQKEPDPAAAIYHYQHALQIRPEGDNAALAKARISACKQALAESVSLGPINDKLQKQFEQLAEENKQLKEESKRLHEELEKWSSYAARLQTLTNQATAPSISPARLVQTTTLAQASLATQPRTGASSNSSAGSSGSRTHTVKSGETPSLIARKYGVKLEALMAANPSLDARRMRVGQTLRIPGT